MTTLVTGATGFVGAAVVRRLLGEGREVRVLARPGSDRRNLAGLPLEIVEGDLLQPSSLAVAVRGCQSLFHVAADYRLWVPQPAVLYATNVKGSESLLLAAASNPTGLANEIAKMLNLSTDAARLDGRVVFAPPAGLVEVDLSEWVTFARARDLDKGDGLVFVPSPLTEETV